MVGDGVGLLCGGWGEAALSQVFPTVVSPPGVDHRAGSLLSATGPTDRAEGTKRPVHLLDLGLGGPDLGLGTPGDLATRWRLGQAAPRTPGHR